MNDRLSDDCCSDSVRCSELQRGGVSFVRVSVSAGRRRQRARRNATICNTASTDQAMAVNVRNPDGSTTAMMIQAMARANPTHTTQARACPEVPLREIVARVGHEATLPRNVPRSRCIL